MSIFSLLWPSDVAFNYPLAIVAKEDLKETVIISSWSLVLPNDEAHNYDQVTVAKEIL